MHMRVHIVTPANRHLYTAQLDQMHRQRRAMFVEKRKWTELDNGSPYEIDEFDHNGAFYLLAVGDVGEVHGSARLVPTWKPHLFGGVLSDYVDNKEAARGPGVWEYSRWLPGSGLDPSLDGACRAALLCATAEFALSHQVEAFVACIETRFLNIFAEVGWPVAFLGEPQRFNRGKAVAIRFAIGPDELQSTRDCFGYSSPSSLELPAWGPDARLDPASFAVLDAILAIEDDRCRRDILEYCVCGPTDDEQESVGGDLDPFLFATTQGNA